MAIDFKLNFNPENSESIDALHERVAWRVGNPDDGGGRGKC